MNPFVRILLGLVITVIGSAMVYKTHVVLSMIGPIEWAERNLGGGGSRTFYKLFGVFVALLGIVVMTNLWDQLVGGTLRWIFGV